MCTHTDTRAHPYKITRAHTQRHTYTHTHNGAQVLGIPAHPVACTAGSRVLTFSTSQPHPALGEPPSQWWEISHREERFPLAELRKQISGKDLMGLAGLWPALDNYWAWGSGPGLSQVSCLPGWDSECGCTVPRTTWGRGAGPRVRDHEHGKGCLLCGVDTPHPGGGLIFCTRCVPSRASVSRAAVAPLHRLCICGIREAEGDGSWSGGTDCRLWGAQQDRSPRAEARGHAESGLLHALPWELG